MKRGQRQSGAALLIAMLTVALVASLATAALWQQWRLAEVERAERERAQLLWVLQGALDWARLILLEDARASDIDHLSEPWAVPLREARLSNFLAVGASGDADVLQAYLSGSIDDQQARLNLNTLVRAAKRDAPTLQAFERLFRQLGLPEIHLALLVQGLERAQSAPTPAAAGAADSAAAQRALPPTRLEHLLWLGVPASTLRTLEPYITLLPEATPVNLNTASQPVLLAVLPGVDAAQLQGWLARRASTHFKTVEEALQGLDFGLQRPNPALLAVRSGYFMVRGRMRLEHTVVEEHSLLEKQRGRVSVRWRQRVPVSVPMSVPASSDTPAVLPSTGGDLPTMKR